MGIESAEGSARKRLRVGHHSERAGINAVRSLMEAHDLVVDEVDGRSDYGRDLNVDLTRGGEITGGIIGVQVKSGRSYFRRGRWVIPAAPADWAYWRSSTVPIVGMVYDPETGVIRWRNLTQAARSRVLASDDSYRAQVQSDDMAEVVITTELSDESFDDFLNRMTAYLDATADSAFLLLLNEEDDVRRQGVFNCWTLGRHDPRPLILLRRLLPTLTGRSLVDGIAVLAHVTPHPDIFWTTRNWISPTVEQEVRATLQWSPDELLELVHKIETMDDGGVDWQRGGVGQSLWSILAVDRTLGKTLPVAARRAVDIGLIDAAIRLLILLQFVAKDPLGEVSAIVEATPGLADDERVSWILEELRDRGQFSPIY